MRACPSLPLSSTAAAIAGLLCLMALNAQAEPATTTQAHEALAPPAAASQELERVVVTATRGAKAVEKIPGAISIISAQEIQQQGLVSEDPSQLLVLKVPGYAPARQKMSNFGEGLRGRNALLLLDGIPQTNPLRFGGREGYFADPMIVERVEVVSGASAAQGMGATGGIINTITRRAQAEGTRHTVDFKLGSQGHADSSSWKAGYMLEHKSSFDVLAYLGTRSQDVGVDGSGRLLATESLHSANDAFLKIGHDFGPQRVQLMLNQFTAEGFDDWVDVPGQRAAGLPTSAKPGSLSYDPLRNQVRSASFEWSHADLAQGAASLQLFKQSFSAVYSGGVIGTFQDAKIAPLNTLVDQSEIQADKWGMRASWVRPDLGLNGLELTAGVDLLNDTSSQRLTQTGRTWVPPLQYRSVAPFTQLEYEQGPLTLRGGLRSEHTRLRVDDYQTLAFYGTRQVEGGERKAEQLVKSLGAVWRFGNSGWSSFVSYNEGFGPPDVGLILRAVKTAGSSVGNLVDLQAIVTDNRELGLAWRGASASMSASLYRSHSDFGSQIVISNGVGTVQRVPIEVEGFEFSGEWRPTAATNLSAIYARTRGQTASAPNQPFNLALGARSQGPEKLVLGAGWAFAPNWRTQLNVQHFLPRHINAGKLAGKTSLEERFDGYTLADLSISWQTKAAGEWGLGLENLFNRAYITYYSQAHYAGSDDDYYAGRGRTATLSWRRSF